MAAASTTGADRWIEMIRAAGVSAWPGIQVGDDALRAVLAPVADRPGPPRFLADLYLVAGCLAGMAPAIAAFDASQMPVVERAVRQLGGTPDEIDEVKQRVRTIALVAAPGQRAALATYRGDGSLGSWVRVVAVRDAYRRLRARTPRTTGTDDDEMFELMTSSDGPETDTMKASYREEFRIAFRAAIAALPRRERTALRLNVLDGLSIDAIGKTFSVHRATAARWLERARDQVLHATRDAMKVRLGIHDAELDSILRLIESHLDVSIATAVGPIK